MRMSLLVIYFVPFLWVGCSGSQDSESNLNAATKTLCGADSNWVQVDPGVKFSQVSVGGDGAVWATDSETTYLRTDVNGANINGTAWFPLSEKDNFSSIAVGKFDFVWGSRGGDEIYYRQGITNSTPDGTAWVSVLQSCSSISAASDYSLWCVYQGVPLLLLGISPSNPQGIGWTATSGNLKAVSVGNVSTIWGITAGDVVATREGASSSDPTGTNWAQVSASFIDVSAGSDGTVWGVNSSGNVFQRVNGAWIQNSNVILKRVAVGNKNNVWGIDSTGSAVRCQN